MDEWIPVLLFSQTTEQRENAYYPLYVIQQAYNFIRVTITYEGMEANKHEVSNEDNVVVWQVQIGIARRVAATITNEFRPALRANKSHLAFKGYRWQMQF